MAGIAGSVLASPRLPLVTRGDPSLQAQLYTLEKHYHIQKELLSRQFEEQRRLLEHEQQMKMEEYIKVRSFIDSTKDVSILSQSPG